MSRGRDKVYTLSDNDVIDLLVAVGDDPLFDAWQVERLLDGVAPTSAHDRRVLRAAKIIGLTIRKRKAAK